MDPVSLYAELKVKFENVILNEIKKKNNFCPTSLRFATAYGISPRMRFDLTINEFTKELALGRTLEIFGEQLWRPYCHVYDLGRWVDPGVAVIGTHQHRRRHESSWSPSRKPGGFPLRLCRQPAIPSRFPLGARHRCCLRHRGVRGSRRWRAVSGWS